MSRHIIKDMSNRYGNDVKIDAGDGDKISLLKNGAVDKTLLNYNFNVISTKLDRLRGRWQALSTSGNITYDASLGTNATIATPSAGAVIGAPQNAIDGQNGIVLIQGGSYTPSWSSAWDFGSNGQPTLVSDTNKRTIVSWVKKGSSFIAVSPVQQSLEVALSASSIATSAASVSSPIILLV